MADEKTLQPLAYNPELSPEENNIALLKHAGIPAARVADFTVKSVVTDTASLTSNKVSINSVEFEGNTVLTLNIPEDLRNKMVVGGTATTAESIPFVYKKVPLRLRNLVRTATGAIGNTLRAQVGSINNGVLLGVHKETEEVSTRIPTLYSDFIAAQEAQSRTMGKGCEAKYVRLRALKAGEAATVTNQSADLTEVKFDTDGFLGYSGQVVDDAGAAVGFYVGKVNNLSNTGKTVPSSVGRLKMLKGTGFTDAYATRVAEGVQLIDLANLDNFQVNKFTSTENRSVVGTLVKGAYTADRYANVTAFAPLLDKANEATATNEQKAYAILKSSEVSGTDFSLTGTNASGNSYSVVKLQTGSTVDFTATNPDLFAKLNERNATFGLYSNLAGQVKVGLVKEAVIDQLAEVHGYNNNFATTYGLTNVTGEEAYAVQGAYAYTSATNQKDQTTSQDDVMLVDLGIIDIENPDVPRLRNTALGVLGKVINLVDQQTHVTLNVTHNETTMVPVGATTENKVFVTFDVSITERENEDAAVKEGNKLFASLFKDFKVTMQYARTAPTAPDDNVRVPVALPGFVETEAAATPAPAQ